MGAVLRYDMKSEMRMNTSKEEKEIEKCTTEKGSCRRKEVEEGGGWEKNEDKVRDSEGRKEQQTKKKTTQKGQRQR